MACPRLLLERNRYRFLWWPERVSTELISVDGGVLVVRGRRKGVRLVPASGADAVLGCAGNVAALVALVVVAGAPDGVAGAASAVAGFVLAWTSTGVSVARALAACAVLVLVLACYTWSVAQYGLWHTTDRVAYLVHGVAVYPVWDWMAPFVRRRAGVFRCGGRGFYARIRRERTD